MRRKSDIAVNALTDERLNIEAQKARRQQQREQTRKWISTTALSTLHLAWRRT
jgi:hypothetical protein